MAEMPNLFEVVRRALEEATQGYITDPNPPSDRVVRSWVDGDTIFAEIEFTIPEYPDHIFAGEKLIATDPESLQTQIYDLEQEGKLKEAAELRKLLNP